MLARMVLAKFSMLYSSAAGNNGSAFAGINAQHALV